MRGGWVFGEGETSNLKSQISEIRDQRSDCGIGLLDVAGFGSTVQVMVGDGAMGAGRMPALPVRSPLLC